MHLFPTRTKTVARTAAPALAPLPAHAPRDIDCPAPRYVNAQPDGLAQGLDLQRENRATLEATRALRSVLGQQSCGMLTFQVLTEAVAELQLLGFSLEQTHLPQLFEQDDRSCAYVRSTLKDARTGQRVQLFAVLSAYLDGYQAIRMDLELQAVRGEGDQLPRRSATDLSEGLAFTWLVTEAASGDGLFGKTPNAMTAQMALLVAFASARSAEGSWTERSRHQAARMLRGAVMG